MPLELLEFDFARPLVVNLADDVQCGGAELADFGVLVVHQVEQVGRSIWRRAMQNLLMGTEYWVHEHKRLVRGAHWSP